MPLRSWDSRGPGAATGEPRSGRQWPPGIRIFLVWIALASSGMCALSLYEFKGGNPDASILRWPENLVIPLDRARPTLVFFIHPRCPCTAASIEQLSRVLGGHPNRFQTVVIAVIPSGTRPDLEDGRNLTAAAQLPGASLVRDRGGDIAARFGVENSGAAMAFAPDSTRLFSGGLTASRGHAGESHGSLALKAIAAGHAPRHPSSPVFGCPLRGSAQVVPAGDTL